MVEFQTIDSRDVKFGNKNFIEVSIKKAVSEEGENVFFSLARGFFTEGDEKRYKKNFSIPNDGHTLEDVLAALSEFKGQAPEQAPEETQEEMPVEESTEETNEE